MSSRHFFLLPLFLLACAAPSQTAPDSGDFNLHTLAAIRKMPAGGGYSGSDAAKNKLVLACRPHEGGLVFSPEAARPSFCSGATYLVFLKALQKSLAPPPALAHKLVVTRDQADGEGIFGRWNANGPGSAKLIADLSAGVNFTAWEKARSGDFLKIWWTDQIGARERGHHVVYLGHDETSVRFWSSNQPDGFGEKTVPRADCRRVLFTRITAPQKLTQASNLPAHDPWLAAMLKKDFTWQEVVHHCRVKE